MYSSGLKDGTDGRECHGAPSGCDLDEIVAEKAGFERSEWKDENKITRSVHCLYEFILLVYSSG